MQFAQFGYMKLNSNLFQIISITLSYEVELKRDYLSYFLLIYVKSHITHAWKISMFSNSICLKFQQNVPLQYLNTDSCREKFLDHIAQVLKSDN